MTTARRVISCLSCGFPTDHLRHLSACVPTSQWPRDLRERKANAMRQVGALCQCGVPEAEHPYHDGTGWHFAVSMEEPVREPEPQKPRGLSEYRRLHPEANPLTAEHITIREFRKRADGQTDEFERVAGIREVLNKTQPCPRCARPMIDRAMHVVCKPVDGSIPPERPESNRLKRDNVVGTPRRPVVHTQAEVVSVAGWYNALPVQTDEDESELDDYVAPVIAQRVTSNADDPAIDPDELADFLGESEHVPPDPSELRARLQEEQESELMRREGLHLVTPDAFDTIVEANRVLEDAPRQPGDMRDGTAPRFICDCGLYTGNSPQAYAAHKRKAKQHKADA